MKYLDSAAFKKLALKRKPTRTGVKYTTSDNPILGETRTFRFVFSDSGVDRDGDSLNAEGWDLTDFRKNSIVLFQHDSQQPIGSASNLKIEEGRLCGDITFAETALADTICELVAGGFLKAVSVGFMPVEYEFSKDPKRPGGVDYKTQRLLEVSVVAIPANPRALIEARFAGIEVAPLAKWMSEKSEDKATPALDRAVYKEFLNNKMSEGDPSDGGFAVPTCTRDEDEECELDDAQECEIHRDDNEEEDEGEKTLMAATQAMKQAQNELKKLNRLVAQLQKDAADGDGDAPRDDDHDGDGDGEEMKSLHLKMAAAHVKAARLFHAKALECHEDAIKCYAAAEKDMEPHGDDEVEDKDEDDSPDRDDDQEDKRFHQIMARARASVR